MTDETLPVSFPEANGVLKGWPADETRPEVVDLPIHRHQGGVISCWQLSDEERRQVAETGVVWLHAMALTHPPVAVSGAYPFLMKAAGD